MINKILKVFSLLLSAMMVFGVSGCTTDMVKPVSAENAVDPTFAIVNDFEKISDLYELEWFGAYGSFGKAELNENPAYVSNGKASMKLNPIGDYREGVTPTYIKIPLNRHKAHNTRNLTSVSFDVFNESGKTATISCALAIDGTNTKYIDFTLQDGEKRTIELEYDIVAMSAVYDIDKVEGIFVRFPKAENRETKSGNIFYLDKFCARYSPFSSKGYNIELAENEFCGFDKIYQEYLVNTNCGTGAIEGYRPELSINTNPLFCADREEESFVFGKNKSLKVVAKGGLNAGNPGFTFSDKLWHNFEWSEMNDKALEFDVYNDSEASFNFSLIIFRNPDNYSVGYYDRFSGGFQVQPYSWTTVKLPIKEWNEATKNTNGNPLTSYIQYGKVVYTYSTPFFAYNGSSVGSADKTFYFDNFRIVEA